MTNRIIHKSVLSLSAVAMALTASTAWTRAADNECTNTSNPHATIIVASNFYEPVQALAAQFVRPGAVPGNPGVGKKIKICHNSTGLIVQEINLGGSPYSLFLAANNTAPGQITVGTIGEAETYALGIPVLWSETKTSRELQVGSTNPQIDKSVVTSLAIGNPSLAPYGKAAEKILTNYLHQWETPVNPPATGWITQYDNIALTLDAIGDESKKVAGFVSKAQVCSRLPTNEDVTHGINDAFPKDYYLVQDGILVDRGAENAAENTLAAAFFNYILSDSVQRQLYEQFCYASKTYQPEN